MLGCMVQMAHVDVLRPPAHVQRGPAWAGKKLSPGKSSPLPALGICPHSSGALWVGTGCPLAACYHSKQADGAMWPQKGMGSHTVLHKLLAELLGLRTFFHFFPPLSLSLRFFGFWGVFFVAMLIALHCTGY